ncbi:MAG TPA: hypothetical protein VN516_03025, partial [Candidatus Baltobacteraceae bacterium]|nr:hypothetical protein [Candidatus Baltobacteraceae bacterium]
NVGDVLICFRKTAGGTFDLAVDAGSVTNFTGLANGQSITVMPTYYTGAQLGIIGTNNISWSAFAHLSASNTIFMTQGRLDYSTQTDPLYRDKASAQGAIISYIKSIAGGMTNYVNYTNASSSTASFVPETAGTAPYISYISGLGPNLNFNDTFQTDPEQSTGASFTTGGQNVRADFYRLDPTTSTLHPSGTFLGYFEFFTNGIITYTAGPSPSVVIAATINSVVRHGTTNTVVFTTGSSGTYTLRGTNLLTASRTNWPVINSTSGTGGQVSLTDVTTNTIKFYCISAQ